MKHLIILISMLTAPLIIQGQEYSAEYKIVCRRVVGCPIEINGTCPTCLFLGKEGTVKKSRETIHREIDEWGERMKKEMKYDYSSLKNDDPSKRRTGWGWDGPTWRGLWVLY